MSRVLEETMGADPGQAGLRSADAWPNGQAHTLSAVAESQPALQALVHQVRALPPLPEALLEVLAALQRSQTPSHRCVQLIERDPAMTATILRLANSAFYGMPGQVQRVADAFRLVGLRSVAAVLLAGSLQQQLDSAAGAGFDFKRYWQHALATALAARALALRAEVDADAAFLAGLMHSVGQVVLAALMPGPMGQAITLARERGMALEDAERQVLGLSDRAVGALLLGGWNFPADVVQAVAAGAAPAPDGGHTQPCLVHVVQTASRLARWLLADPQGGAQGPPDELGSRCLLLGLQASEWPALLEQLREGTGVMAG